MRSANRPFRWDLVQRDQLGTLLDGTEEPDLWYLDELTACAAKVLARSANGNVYFVGRSADSIFDLLGGALSATSWRDRLRQLPLSLGWAARDLDPNETSQLRANLTSCGLEPTTVSRANRPTVFVDLVDSGETFGNLYGMFRDWVADRSEWHTLRLKLRFIGITLRTKTSPNTYRWQQWADWTREIPASSVRNVSLDGRVWSLLGDLQSKITPSFDRWRWSAQEINSPNRDPATRQALREAVALVEAGRRLSTRDALVKNIATEPTMSERWLRNLVQELRTRKNS